MYDFPLAGSPHITTTNFVADNSTNWSVSCANNDDSVLGSEFLDSDRFDIVELFALSLPSIFLPFFSFFSRLSSLPSLPYNAHISQKVFSSPFFSSFCLLALLWPSLSYPFRSHLSLAFLFIVSQPCRSLLDLDLFSFVLFWCLLQFHLSFSTSVKSPSPQKLLSLALYSYI